MTKQGSFFNQDIEWKVSIFTTLLVIAIFVTVAIYVYAGAQQNLPTRNFSSVDIRNSLKVGQKTFKKREVYNLEDGDTISPIVDGSDKIFMIESGKTIILPPADTFDKIPELSPGYTTRFHILNNSSTQTVTLVSNDPLVTFLNGNSVTIPPATSRKVMIRKTTEHTYQAILV